jgi:hypothetical protein
MEPVPGVTRAFSEADANHGRSAEALRARGRGVPSALAERRHTGAEQGRGAATVAVRLPSIGSGGIGS